MASLSRLPLHSCSVGHMFSFSSASFRDSCIKCSLFADLEESLSDLEAIICTLPTKPLASLAKKPPLAGDGQFKAAPSSTPASPEQHPPKNQGSWVTVWRKQSMKQKPTVHHPPVHVSNRFSPLRNQLYNWQPYIVKRELFHTSSHSPMYSLGQSRQHGIKYKAAGKEQTPTQ